MNLWGGRRGCAPLPPFMLKAGSREAAREDFGAGEGDLRCAATRNVPSDGPRSTRSRVGRGGLAAAEEDGIC